MIYHIHIAALTLLMIACGSGGVFSQITGISEKDLIQAFFKEMQTSEDEMRQFGESLRPLFEDIQQNAQAKAMEAMMERMQDASNPMTPEEGMKLGMNIVMDGIVEMQKPINDKAVEFFSEEIRHAMHTRVFQLNMGIMERLAATDDEIAIHTASGFAMMQLMIGQPDFLELSPEQRELITNQQKDTSIESMSLSTQATMKMMTENPERLAEIQQLSRDLENAEDGGERDEIAQKLFALTRDMRKDIVPDLKRIALKSHEDFMRVLTDAQKAKIKAVMADMPDYIKTLLAEIDKGNDVSSVLNSWVPGMGAPGTNPNREAPRERPQRERTFPVN